jgi:hypothetical protein
MKIILTLPFSLVYITVVMRVRASVLPPERQFIGLSISTQSFPSLLVSNAFYLVDPLLYNLHIVIIYFQNIQTCLSDKYAV